MKKYYTIKEFFEKMEEETSFGNAARILLQSTCILAFIILFLFGAIAFIAWDFTYFGVWMRALIVFSIIFIFNLKKW